MWPAGRANREYFQIFDEAACVRAKNLNLIESHCESGGSLCVVPDRYGVA